MTPTDHTLPTDAELTAMAANVELATSKERPAWFDDDEMRAARRRDQEEAFLRCPAHLRRLLSALPAIRRDEREKVADAIKDEADRYEKDGEPGDLGLNCWGWRDIAATLRGSAERLARGGGEGEDRGPI